MTPTECPKSRYSAAVFVGYAALAYTTGFAVYVWWALSITVACAVGTWLFAPRWPRLRQRLGIIAPLEYVAKRFNVATEQVLAWSGALLKIFDVAAKWTASAVLLNVFAGIPLSWGILLVGGVTMIYSTIGGIWADVLTDFGQFVTQFIAAFGWSNIATIVATNGAQYLKDINMTGLPALLGFMLFGQCIALFVASGSAIWAMLSPVFVPMFMLLGYHPAFVQLAFRAGDTSLNSIMLVNPFLPLFIDMLQKYKSESGIGTYLSLMVPYAFTYMVTWYLLFSAWYFFELPIGPGIGQRLM